MKRADIHEILNHAFEQLASLHGQCAEISPDAAFAIGYAAGSIAKAKALVGRDIDDNGEKE